MKLIDFIICDDIRKEDNGKTILIGVYSDRMIFQIDPPGSKWPLQKRLSLYFRLKKEIGDPEFDGFDLTIDLKTQKSEKPHLLAEINGTITGSSTPESLVILEFSIPFVFIGPGKMVVAVKIKKAGKVVSVLNPDYEMEIEETTEPVTA